jgi:hypothetical protein
MKPVVSINDPCHESWDKMNPQEQGRHCDSCCKLVVDFTKMSNNAIAKYLAQRTEQKVCGRFKMEQVASLPEKRIRFSFNVKRFAAAVFIAFGSFLFASCSSSKPQNPEIMGDVAYIPDTAVTQQPDSATTQHLMGKPRIVPVDTTEKMIMGEVCIDPRTKDSLK